MGNRQASSPEEQPTRSALNGSPLAPAPHASGVRLNTQLAKKPKECLEYIVVHEMVHLLEPNHGPRFQALMSQHLSGWKSARALLNQLPISD